MSHGVALCFVIALMFVLLKMRDIPSMTYCPFCGRTKEHARDCPTKKTGGENGS